MNKELTGVNSGQNQTGLLQGKDTPQFDDRSVDTTTKNDIMTQSAIQELNQGQPNLMNREVKNGEIAQTSNESNPMIEVLRELKTIVAEHKSVTENLGKLQQGYTVREQEIIAKEKQLAEDQKTLQSLTGKASNDGVESLESKRKNAPFLILKGIQDRLPVLAAEYEKLKTNHSKEASINFVSFYVSEIASAFKNVTAQIDKPQIGELKKQIDLGLREMDSFKKNPQIAEFVKLVLQQIQDPEAKVTPPAKYMVAYAWMYNLLNSLKAFIALTSAYMLGKSEAYILSLLPLAVKNLVSAIQQYAGSPTVPLLCFGIAYALYLLVQVGAAAKEKKWPTDAKVAEEAQKQAITKLFAQNAIVV